MSLHRAGISNWAQVLEEIAPEDKNRNEVLDAGVVLYIATKKWDMAAPFHRSHEPELLLRGNLLLAFIPLFAVPFFGFNAKVLS
jgi:hypothetical protein